MLRKGCYTLTFTLIWYPNGETRYSDECAIYVTLDTHVLLHFFTCHNFNQILWFCLLWDPTGVIYIYIYIYIYTHTYIYIYTYFIRGFALAQGTFLLVIFAWICYDGFESQLRNGYLLKCDCLFDCNWHIGTIKWQTKIDILGWRDRGSNSRPLAQRAGALSIALHLIQLIRWFHNNFI